MSGTKEITLETLTPIILDEEQKEKLNYKSYETILNEVFATEEFCNIALTGPYGAGKSTIMNTYECEHEKEMKTIHISLAKFNDEDADNMQAKLINQIIHQIDPKMIPQTRFKVKEIVSGGKVVVLSVVVFAFMLSMLYLFNVPKTQMLEESNISLFNMFWTHKLNIVMLIFALVSSLSLLIAIVNAQLKKPLIKTIQVDKSQIDLVESDEFTDSSQEKFDKYMDEIIYLFQRSKVDALVIEDLDRFEDTKIFYELRQMNFLLNQKCADKENKKGTCKKVKFIYMVRDKLFKDSEERTKFFDIIIPIVPVMDNSNSYELMKKMLGDEWLEKLDKAYLKTICLYIRDYRILKNIFNEFQIYYNQLQIEEHKYDAMKLFAMITYKNLWPTDFAELQQRKGSVFTALESIEKLREIKIEALETEITALQKEKDAMETELTESLDELDAIYFSECLYASSDHAGYYIVDGINEYDFPTRREFIRALKDATSVAWRRANSYANLSIAKDKIKKCFEDLGANAEYEGRKRRLQERSGDGIENIEKKIENKKQEMQNIGEAQFKKLTAETLPESISALFPEDKQLIQIFLQDEMISADYPAYMTYFYPYSITNEERKYLNKVYARTNDEEQAEIAIDHPELVVEYLKLRDWESVALPNNDLYEYLVKQDRENLKKAILNLREHSNVEFAAEFLQKLIGTVYANVWVNELLEEWENFVEELIETEVWTLKHIMQIILQILGYLKEDKIPDVLIRDFLATVEPDLIEVCTYEELKKLAKIDYKFKKISLVTKDVQEFVYQNAMYQISKENIEYVLEKYYPLQETMSFNEDNFLIIMSEEESPLATYVSKELEVYLSCVYIPYYAAYSMNNSVLLEFLNNDKVHINIRKKLVEKTTLKIDDIKKVNEVDIVNEIVQQKKMAFTNTNVLFVWGNEEKLSSALHDYLKEQYKTDKCSLSFVFIKKYFKETYEEHPKAEALVNELLGLADFGESYKNLVADVNICYQGLKAITWNEEQMNYIVRTRTIDMTEKNLKLMRAYENKKLFYQWLISNVEVYLKLMDKEELRVDTELLYLIASAEVADNEKISCIEICTKSVPISENYNTRVVQMIFEKDLFDGNFEPVIKRYSANRYGKQLMKDLGEYMVSYISDTVRIKSRIPFELLMHVMQSESVTNQNKKQILAKQATYYSLETVEKCLQLAGANEYLNAFEGHKPRVEANETNQVLIEALIKCGWISSYKAVEDEYILYPKRCIV